MEQLKAKLKKQGGFTMVELLIVVAIIAILVAVSIPMMNNALERSRHAVDQANIRDAIGLISVEYTTNPDAFENGKSYYYCVEKDTHQGYLSETKNDNTTPASAACTCDGSENAGDLFVELVPPDTVGVGEKPTIKVSWTFSDTDGTGKNSDNPPTEPSSGSGG